jgi:hypothetical protein
VLVEATAGPSAALRSGRDDNFVTKKAFIKKKAATNPVRGIIVNGITNLSSRPERSAVEGPAVAFFAPFPAPSSFSGACLALTAAQCGTAKAVPFVERVFPSLQSPRRLHDIYAGDNARCGEVSPAYPKTEFFRKREKSYPHTGPSYIQASKPIGEESIRGSGQPASRAMRRNSPSG